MKVSNLIKILLRLYNSYVKKYLYKVIIALFLSFGVAGGTAAIAWLLDPAVKKIFLEQDTTMMVMIPFAIVLAFSIKGLSLYFARTILIKIGNSVVKELQVQLSSSVLKSLPVKIPAIFLTDLPKPPLHMVSISCHPVVTGLRNFGRYLSSKSTK